MKFTYLESRPDRASGELTIKGTRIRIAQVISMLANGSTLEQLHEGWPWVSVTTLRGAIQEATEYLSAKTHAETVLQT
jgi:uncharacterized protein (DUF433 family)